MLYACHTPSSLALWYCHDHLPSGARSTGAEAPDVTFALFRTDARTRMRAVGPVQTLPLRARRITLAVGARCIAMRGTQTRGEP
jgi:hypothetical protein